jgi:AraC family transcriptional regulator
MHKTLVVKNLHFDCGVILLKKEFQRHGITVLDISPGRIELELVDQHQLENLVIPLLNEVGITIIKEKEEVIVERILELLNDLVYNMNNVDSIVRKSDYLVEMMNMPYHQISRLFSKYHPISIEKYIINLKIERIKELITEDEYSLSEIAFMMDYSSLQHLSTQFKKITGLTISEHKSGIKR